MNNNQQSNGQIYGPPIEIEKSSQFYLRKFKKEISYCKYI